jgi:hypothetical protein
LKDFEKKALQDQFNQTEGSVYKRAEKAIAAVLHGDPSYMYQKAEALDDVKHLIGNIRSIAADFDKDK